MFDYEFEQAELVIRVSGRFGKAGKVEFRLAGERVDEVLLPKVEWAAFAILAHAGANAPVDSIEAFLSSPALAKQLLRRRVFKLDDPQNAIRTVFRLRWRLATTVIARRLAEDRVIEDARDFGKQLIARHQFLGYRINVPPGDVKLDIQEDF